MKTKTNKNLHNKSIKNLHNKTIKHKNSLYPPFPIDIVYTWKGEDILDDQRLSYNYELKYSLRSIELYANWVNKIFILMNKKIQPSCIKYNNKIIVVEHSETFPSKKYLPNTNSNAIETTIANIRGLSEHYIYFNDDVFLGKKTKYTHFFTPDGKAIVDDFVLISRNILKDKHNNKLNIKFPESSLRLYKHIPIPQIKSLVLKFNKKYSDYINWIRMTKRRIHKGFDICIKNNLNSPCQQIHYPIAKYMYQKQKAVVINNDNNENIIYVGSGNPDFVKMLNDIFKIKPLFFCINDTELDPKKRETKSKIRLSFFNKYYPDKSSIEK